IMAGMGLDARMVRDADRELKRRYGVLAYVIAAGRNLNQRYLTYTMTIDGERFRRRAQMVLVANLGRITGGLELVPGADPEDGLLEVAILRARRFSDVARVAGRALLGIHRSDDLFEIHRGRHVVITTDRPQPVELDGNDVGSTIRLE